MNAKKLLLGTLGIMASLGMSGNTSAYFGETAAFDFPSGFYVGLQLGYAQTWWKDLNGLSSPLFSIDGSSTSVAAGRLLVGYEFNEFFAVEAGFAYVKGGVTMVTQLDIVPATIQYQTRLKEAKVDVVGKISLPLDNGFRIFTKAGVAYTKSNSAPEFIFSAPYVFADPDRKVVNVVFGVGANYAITPAFSVEGSWVYYRGNSKVGFDSNKYYPDTDFYTLGLTYKFLCS